MNLLNDAAAWLKDQHGEHCSEEVTYTPAGGQPIMLQAVLTIPRPEQVDSDVGAIARLIDMIIDWPDWTPKAGDLVEHGDRKLRVTQDPQEGPFRPADAYGYRMRIHLQETSR